MRERLIEALRLKDLPRAGWVRVGVQAPESVAAHSWGVAWLVLVLCPPELDRGRALAIAVIHDLPEVRVGDLTPQDQVADKAEQEQAAWAAMTQDLPGRDDLRALHQEYGQTPEGRFVRACDKLDMALQAALYEADQGLDLQEFVDSALAKLPPGVLRSLAQRPSAS